MTNMQITFFITESIRLQVVEFLNKLNKYDVEKHVVIENLTTNIKIKDKLTIQTMVLILNKSSENLDKTFGQFFISVLPDGLTNELSLFIKLPSKNKLFKKFKKAFEVKNSKYLNTLDKNYKFIFKEN